MSVRCPTKVSLLVSSHRLRGYVSVCFWHVEAYAIPEKVLEEAVQKLVEAQTFGLVEPKLLASKHFRESKGLLRRAR